MARFQQKLKVKIETNRIVAGDRFYQTNKFKENVNSFGFYLNKPKNGVQQLSLD